MEKHTIHCDECQRDLTTTGNCEDWYLAVGSEAKRYRGGVVTMMGIQPPTDRKYHFCGWECFDSWRDREREEAEIVRGFNKQWDDKHGKTHDNGMRSVVMPPQEVQEEWQKLAREMAEGKFPRPSSARNGESE